MYKKGKNKIKQKSFVMQKLPYLITIELWWTWAQQIFANTSRTLHCLLAAGVEQD